MRGSPMREFKVPDDKGPLGLTDESSFLQQSSCVLRNLHQLRNQTPHSLRFCCKIRRFRARSFGYVFTGVLLTWRMMDHPEIQFGLESRNATSCSTVHSVDRHAKAGFPALNCSCAPSQIAGDLFPIIEQVRIHFTSLPYRKKLQWRMR